MGEEEIRAEDFRLLIGAIMGRELPRIPAKIKQEVYCRCQEAIGNGIKRWNKCKGDTGAWAYVTVLYIVKDVKRQLLKTRDLLFSPHFAEAVVVDREYWEKRS